MAYVTSGLTYSLTGRLAGISGSLRTGVVPQPATKHERREQHEAQSALHREVSFQFLKTLIM